ncbi:MAG TPA: biotin/lipoyl-containing protein [Gemmataceae bacterium]|nr:biotin/lipoyl-containing protein [Gemmataceae bacterium]
MKLKITLDGKVYEVDVDVSEPDPAGPAYVPPAGTAHAPAAAPHPAPGAAPVANESKVCRTPIAGTVSKVPIQVGQAIKVNDVLLVLEAMKMETVITAPIAGKVARINAAVGDVVQGGQVLVEFE